MSSPYRESAAPSVHCARCGKAMPPGELAGCVDNCGSWVTADLAHTVFEASELKPSRIASWFRERGPCPACGKQMTLRGHDMSLFQGCDQHGFFVDADVVTQTGLGRVAHAALLSQMREKTKQLRAEHARAAAIEREIELSRGRTEEERARARQAERHAAEEAARLKEARRLQALRDAKREAYGKLVQNAIEHGHVMPLVDELLRLDDAITALANRVTDIGG